MSRIQLQRTCVIQRPIDVVKSQYNDFEHHIAKQVHPGIAFTILGREGARQRIQSKFKVMGLPKTDESWLGYDAAGVLVQEFTKGDFAGGTIKIKFTPEGKEATRLEASLDFPLRGINRLMAPLVRRVVTQLSDKALEEDKRDLEQGGYQPRKA